MTRTTLRTITANDVLFYVPNLIGYARVLCSCSSFVIMILSSGGNWWILATVLYVASFAGDLFDGMAARALRQTSEYGGLLDMVTDRCSTTGLLYVLDGEYSRWSNHDDGDVSSSASWRLLFLFLIILDISSHWCQMFSSSSLKDHHKSKTANAGRFFLVRWYYGSYPFFGYCCVGAEFTYIALYVLRHLTEENTPYAWYVARAILTVCVPACAVKQVVNVSQLCSASYAVAARDAERKNEERSR